MESMTSPVEGGGIRKVQAVQSEHLCLLHLDEKEMEGSRQTVHLDARQSKGAANLQPASSNQMRYWRNMSE